MNIPFIDLKAQQKLLRSDIDRRIAVVLDHGKYIMGPEVAELENMLADFAGVRHAVTVSSGTDAILMALMAADIGQGDAVFLPAFTFTATAEVVLMVGATPVFVDVDPHTCNIDPDDLSQRIDRIEQEGNLSPRAIISVDLFGLPADYPKLGRIAARYDMLLIDDAAQSFGGAQGNKRVGALAPVTATSFFPAKPLGCYGDGGAVFTNDDEIAETYKSIRAHGKGGAKYDIIRVGLNARLDTMQAAVLLAKLCVFAEEIESRDKLARLYDARLSGSVNVPARTENSVSAWAQYTVQLENRDKVQETLKVAGIPTMVYYPLPMHLQSAYRPYGDGEGSMPVSEHLSKSVLSLPMHPYMEDKVAHFICDSIISATDQL
jgi:UDP-2-acetamido-2-deoxy-ribo-hexuluronate aminotransferase